MEAQTPPSSSDHPPITMTQHPPAKTLASATHPYGPAASNHSLRPSPGPSFKDLLRRTRSPLRMTPIKSQLLSSPRSRQALSLPTRLFSWSAAASLGMLATFSFDAPAFGHAIPKDYPYAQRRPVPHCTSRMLSIFRNGEGSPLSPDYENNDYVDVLNDDRFIGIVGGRPTVVIAYAYAWKPDDDDEGYSYSRFPGDISVPISISGVLPGYNYCHIHRDRDNRPSQPRRNRAPLRTRLSFPSLRLDLIRKKQITLNLDRYFTDPDGDELTYTAFSDNNAVEARVRGNTLYLVGNEITTSPATIEITARDSEGLSFDFSLTGISVTEGGQLCDHTPEERLSVINQRRGIITRGDRDSNGNLILTQDRLLEPKHYCNDVIIVSNQSLRLEDQDPSDVTRLTGSYTVVLGAQPGADVFVNVHTTNSDVSVSPNLLIFTRANWNQPQTVNVTSYIDITGGVISHSVESDGSPYYRWLGNNVYSPLPLYVDITGYGEQEEDDQIDDQTEDTIEDNTDDQTDDQTEDTIEDNTDDQTDDQTQDIIEQAKEGLSEKSKEKLREATKEINKQAAEERRKAKIELALAVAKEVPKVIAKEILVNTALAPLKIPKAAKSAIGLGVSIIDMLKSSNSSNEQINSLAENLYIHHEALQNGTVSFDQSLSGRTFSFPFNLSQASTEDQESSPRFNALLNADIDFSRFSDSSDPDLYIDGTTTNYGIGLTVIPNPEVPLLTGLEFGYTRSNSDFEYLEASEGTYNLKMFSVHPFIVWDASDSLTFWTTLGYGRPNTETTINSIIGLDFDSTEEVSYSSSGDFFSFAGGANYRVWQSDASALSLNLSGSTASFLDNDFQEGRIAAQLSHDFPLNAGQLQTSADLALLLSDSDPSVMELSGQLNWLPNQGRLSGSTNARVLLLGGDRSEWGIGGSVVLLPGERGEGLSLALQPSFGQTNTSLSSLHLDPFSFSDPTELALSTAPLTARFNAEMAYGFRTGNHALLTPYIDASLAHSSNTYTTGLRYHLDSGLDLDLSASHRTRSSGNNDNRFFLQLRSDL